MKRVFLHVDVPGPRVNQGHYDLVGSEGEIILPRVWGSIIEPRWLMTMFMWPIPEPKPKSGGKSPWSSATSTRIYGSKTRSSDCW